MENEGGCGCLIIIIIVILITVLGISDCNSNSECERKSIFEVGQQVKIKGLDSKFIVKYKQCQRGVEYLTLISSTGEVEILEASFIEK